MQAMHLHVQAEGAAPDSVLPEAERGGPSVATHAWVPVLLGRSWWWAASGASPDSAGCIRGFWLCCLGLL